MRRFRRFALAVLFCGTASLGLVNGLHSQSLAHAVGQTHFVAQEIDPPFPN